MNSSLKESFALQSTTCRHFSSKRVVVVLAATERGDKKGRIEKRSRETPLEKSVSSRRSAIVCGSLAAFSAFCLFPEYSSASEEVCDYFTGEGGLQYCDVREGSGEVPVKGDLIKAHYTGSLASNGQVFDSSYRRGSPLVFKIGVREVIAGWDIGILGGKGIPPMKEGGLRKLRIPAALAYGERGAGRGLIPPNATLNFDVEYLGTAIKK